MKKYILIAIVLSITQLAVADTFHGYECSGDCSGHEAGYEWAEEKGIDDPEDCGGKSESFEEGCKAYAGEEGDADEEEEEPEEE